MQNPFKKHSNEYSEPKLWEKITNFAKQAGQKTVYAALLLYYAYKRKDTPAWAKNIVLGTLGYFIAPIDALPDLTPLIGYTDDLGVLSFGLATIATYINDEVKGNARERIQKWFGEVDEGELDEVDKQI